MAVTFWDEEHFIAAMDARLRCERIRQENKSVKYMIYKLTFNASTFSPSRIFAIKYVLRLKSHRCNLPASYVVYRSIQNAPCRLLLVDQSAIQIKWD